eukprot:CAMPEP_0195302134 /NCGR_PEP_ID=MMETSP0707-20130614/30534_1 /TAXON_ID=33640 /ORGANISM="Asterionellopsis glacialis, Strain CCMP134" /LENGTH=499 /DNA_ID=CAMNT_0040365297 /DNA_START=158 /DNA_END=1657 /DNA_ORIENTATION=-
MNEMEFDYKKELRAFADLAVPTVTSQLMCNGAGALTASYVGRHLGSICLDGFTLALLSGNLLIFSVVTGIFTASDTLSAQAYGADNFRSVGLIAVRGFIASMLVLAPLTLLLCLKMHKFLIIIGEEDAPSHLAVEWFRIYAISVPFYAVFQIIWKFLSAQGVMRPIVYVCLLCTGVILPLALEVLIPILGFKGSAWAMVIYNVSQPCLLILYLAWRHPHHPGTWPGFSKGFLGEAFELKQLKLYLLLGIGGIFSVAEWWFWEVISLLVGTFGIVPLSVHTVPAQVITVACMIPIGMGIALAIRIGASLPRSVKVAKAIVFWTYMGGTVIFSLLTLLMWILRQQIFAFFTHDQNVIDGCNRIWWKVCIYFLFFSIFGLNLGVFIGLGMQWTLGIITAMSLWLFGLPCIYYFSVFLGGGIDAVWTWMIPPYIAMNAILVIVLYFTDWYQIQKDIRKREGLQDIDDNVSDDNIETSGTIYGSTTERRGEECKLLVNKVDLIL